MVNDIANNNIINEIIQIFSFNNNEKNARSGKIFEFFETAIKPENPITNTMGTIIKNDKIKLFFNLS